MVLIKKYNIPIIQLDNTHYVRFLGNAISASNEPEIKTEDPVVHSKEYDANLSGAIPTQNPSIMEEKECVSEIVKYYPSVDNSNGKGKTKHNLIMPRDLKKLMLVVNTANGDRMREYVIWLDELFQLYSSYQNALVYKQKEHVELYFHEEKERHERTYKKLEEALTMLGDMKETLEVNEEVLHEINEKFDKATDERAPKTKSEATREKFVIVKLNKHGYPWDYYAIRCQNSTIKRSLKKVKGMYPEATILIDITYQPNSRNLYNLMRESLRDSIIVRRNEIQLVGNFTEEQFVLAINKLDEAKKDVEDVE